MSLTAKYPHICMSHEFSYSDMTWNVSSGIGIKPTTSQYQIRIPHYQIKYIFSYFFSCLFHSWCRRHQQFSDMKNWLMLLKKKTCHDMSVSVSVSLNFKMSRHTTFPTKIWFSWQNNLWHYFFLVNSQSNVPPSIHHDKLSQCQSEQTHHHRSHNGALHPGELRAHHGQQKCRSNGAFHPVCVLPNEARHKVHMGPNNKEAPRTPFPDLPLVMGDEETHCSENYGNSTCGDREESLDKWEEGGQDGHLNTTIGSTMRWVI